MTAKKNKLEVTLPSDREIQFVRDFDAPRDLVWDVFTKPEHIKQWWGNSRLTMTVCEMDLRVGGSYRFVGRTPDGNEVPFKGEHREIVPRERLVFTEIFDVPPYDQFPSQVTAVFTEHGDKTRVTITMLHVNKEVRDAVIATGMEQGAAESYDYAERVMARLRERAAG